MNNEFTIPDDMALNLSDFALFLSRRRIFSREIWQNGTMRDGGKTVRRMGGCLGKISEKV